MNVHSATCSRSVELYKLWYTLADFFAKLGYFAVFFYTLFTVRFSDAAMGGAGDIIFSAWLFFILFAERISEAAMGRMGVWGHNMINKKRQKESCATPTRIFFPKLEFLYLILILLKGTAKLRWGGGGRKIFFWV